MSAETTIKLVASQHDKYFRVTAEDIEACRKQNILL